MQDEKSSGGPEDQVSEEELLAFSQAPSNASLGELRLLGEEYVNKVREAQVLAGKLSELNAEIQLLESRRLPDAMSALGIDFLGLPEVGADLEAKNYYKAAIPNDWPEENRQRAFEYLRQLGAAGLIRTEVLAAFGAGEDERAVEIANLLVSQNVAVETKMNVPWSTLTSFVRERIEAGLPLDREKLNATVGRVVKIKAREGDKKRKKEKK